MATEDEIQMAMAIRASMGETEGGDEEQDDEVARAIALSLEKEEPSGLLRVVISTVGRIFRRTVGSLAG